MDRLDVGANALFLNINTRKPSITIGELLRTTYVSQCNSTISKASIVEIDAIQAVVMRSRTSIKGYRADFLIMAVPLSGGI